MPGVPEGAFSFTIGVAFYFENRLHPLVAITEVSWPQLGFPHAGYDEWFCASMPSERADALPHRAFLPGSTTIYLLL